MSFKLAQILTQEDIITEDEMDAIFERRQEQGDQGLSLDAELCQEGYLTPQQVNTYLAQALKYDEVDLNTLTTPSSSALRAIPKKLAEKNRILGYQLEDDELNVAVGLPLSKKQLRQLEEDLSLDFNITPISQIYLAQLQQTHYGIEPPEALLPLIEKWPLSTDSVDETTEETAEPVETKVEATETAEETAEVTDSTEDTVEAAEAVTTQTEAEDTAEASKETSESTEKIAEEVVEETAEETINAIEATEQTAEAIDATETTDSAERAEDNDTVEAVEQTEEAAKTADNTDTTEQTEETTESSEESVKTVEETVKTSEAEASEATSTEETIEAKEEVLASSEDIVQTEVVDVEAADTEVAEKATEVIAEETIKATEETAKAAEGTVEKASAETTDVIKEEAENEQVEAAPEEQEEDAVEANAEEASSEEEVKAEEAPQPIGLDALTTTLLDDLDPFASLGDDLSLSPSDLGALSQDSLPAVTAEAVDTPEEEQAETPEVEPELVETAETVAEAETVEEASTEADAPEPPETTPTAETSQEIVEEDRGIASLNIDELALLLPKAQTRDGALELGMYFCASLMDQAALLLVPKQKVVGHRLIAEENLQKAFQGIEISLTSDTVFKRIQDSMVPYYGPIPNYKADQCLFMLFYPAPKVVYFVPVKLKGRTVAALYGHQNEEALNNEEFGQLMRCNQLMSGALEHVIRCYKKGVREEDEEIQQILQALKQNDWATLDTLLAPIREIIAKQKAEDELFIEEPELAGHYRADDEEELDDLEFQDPEMLELKKKEEPIVIRRQNVGLYGNDDISQDSLDAMSSPGEQTEGSRTPAFGVPAIASPSTPVPNTMAPPSKSTTPAFGSEAVPETVLQDITPVEEESSQTEEPAVAEELVAVEENTPVEENTAPATEVDIRVFSPQDAEPSIDIDVQTAETDEAEEHTTEAAQATPAPQEEPEVSAPAKAKAPPPPPAAAFKQTRRTFDVIGAHVYGSQDTRDGAMVLSTAQNNQNAYMDSYFADSDPLDKHIPLNQTTDLLEEFLSATDIDEDSEISNAPTGELPAAPDLTLETVEKEWIFQEPFRPPRQNPKVDEYTQKHASLLLEGDEETQDAAIEALRGMEPSRAVLALLSEFPANIERRHVRDEGHYAEEYSITAEGRYWSLLREFPEETVVGLAPLLYHPSPYVQIMTLSMLPGLPHAGLLPYIFRLLMDPNPSLYNECRRVLQFSKDTNEYRAIVTWLRSILKQPQSPHIAKAIRTLTVLRDVDTVPSLINLLKHDDHYITELAFESLQEITKQNLSNSQRKWRKWWDKTGSRTTRVDWLIEGLQQRNLELQHSAVIELKELTQQDFGFDPNGPRRQRNQAIQQWKQWRKEHP